MKKWLSLLFALVLAFSLASSFAEEPPESAGAFEAALQQWSESIDLSKADYRLSWLSEGQASEAFIRGDKDLTLIEIPAVGKVQLSKDKLVLQLESGTTMIDLSSLMTFRGSPENLSADAQMFSLLLLQGFREVLMPSAETTSNENGTILHISIDNQVFVRRLYNWLDTVFRNPSTRSLIARCSGSLKSVIPGLPQTEEELLPWWEAEYTKADKVEKTSTLELDVISSGSHGNMETVAFGTLVSPQSTFDLDFELVNAETGLSLKAYALETERSRTVSSYTVYLSRRGDDLSIHSSTDSVRTGSASLDLEIDGSDIRGNFTERDRNYTITGSRNVSANSADIRIRRVGSEVPEGADLSFAPDRLFIRSFDKDQSVRCSVSSASTYGHLSILGESSLPGGDYSCDFWTIKTPTGGSLVRYRQTGAAGGNPYSTVNMWLRSETDCMEGEVESTLFNTTSQESFRLKPGENGFTLEAHESRRIGRDEREVSLILGKAGNQYTYDLSVPKDGRRSKVTGDFIVNDGQRFVSASGVVTEEDLRTGEQKQTGRYEFTPRKGIVENAEGVHTMEVVKDTAEEMVWEARSNDQLTSTLAAVLSDTGAGTAFTCSSEENGETVMSFSMTPLAKEEVTPIDESDAFIINAQTLPAILKQLVQAN